MTPVPDIDAFEERAAIIQHDGVVFLVPVLRTWRLRLKVSGMPTTTGRCWRITC